MALPSDLIDLLAEFAATGVEYLLVGGQALALQGHPRFTKDADLWLRDTADNLGRAQQALLQFGAPRSVVDASSDSLPSSSVRAACWTRVCRVRHRSLARALHIVRAALQITDGLCRR
jgi:hypothetical protein